MRSSSRRAWLRLAGASLAVACLAGVIVDGSRLADPAHALDLPTWDDVQAAKQNESAAAAKVTEIESLIAASQAELERLRVESAAANEAWQKAEAEAQAAAEKALALETQAAESQKKADEAADQAAVIVAQMYRSGGVDRNMELFLQPEGDTADALLERLASMSKATERNTVISQEAEQAMNTAASLGKQAEAAKVERDRLSEEAQKKALIAAKAADDQRVKMEAQQQQQTVLQAQLAALKDTTTSTVAGYEERLRVEEEQRRQAAAAAAEQARREAEERARRAAEANANGGGGGGGSVGGGGGGGGSNGWWRPTPGWISTTFYQVPGHTGIDLAIGCGTPIIAPYSGTISFVGWKDRFGGNMVHIDHGSGVQTRYAHLDGFGPGRGSWVNQGDVIGYVGNTGMSTGCHLHYEALVGGIFQNPIPNFGVTG